MATWGDDAGGARPTAKRTTAARTTATRTTAYLVRRVGGVHVVDVVGGLVDPRRSNVQHPNRLCLFQRDVHLRSGGDAYQSE